MSRVVLQSNASSLCVHVRVRVVAVRSDQRTCLLFDRLDRRPGARFVCGGKGRTLVRQRIANHVRLRSLFPLQLSCVDASHRCVLIALSVVFGEFTRFERMLVCCSDRYERFALVLVGLCVLAMV